MQLGVFLDLSNLYYQAKRKYGGKIDFAELKSFISDLGDIKILNAYGSQRQNEANKFIKYLESCGYNPVYKATKEIEKGKYKANWDVGITVDIIRNEQNFDTLILGTSDSDYAPLIKYLKEANNKVYIIGIDISGSLKMEADDYLNIPSSVVKDKI